MPEMNGTETNGHDAQAGLAGGGGRRAARAGRPGGAGGDGRRLASLTLVPKATVRSATRDFKSDQEVRWCPGCGDYATRRASRAFLPERELPAENVVVIRGFGCPPRLPYYVNPYGMPSIHGRAPAI